MLHSDQSTVPEIIEHRAGSSPDAPAIGVRDSSTSKWQVVNWHDLMAQIEHIAAMMRVAGIGTGDCIAVLGSTSHHWLLIEQAAMFNGAVVVGIDPHLTPTNIATCLHETSPKVLFVDASQAELPRDLFASVPLSYQFTSTSIEFRWENLSTGEVLENTRNEAVGKLAPTASPDSTATVIYTSGTTGNPKGIRFSHLQLSSACRAIQSAFPEVREGDATICWLPMAHLFQRMMNLAAMSQGATVYFVNNPLDLIDAAQKTNPTVLIGVPRFFEKLHAQIKQEISQRPPLIQRLFRNAVGCSAAVRQRTASGEKVGAVLRLKQRSYDRLILSRIRRVLGKNIKFMVSGSAPLSESQLAFFADIGCPVLEAYGISENVIPMSANRLRHNRMGSVGIPFPMNEIRIAGDGEVLVRGPGVCQGYVGCSDVDKRFQADGFFSTGDLGRLDDDGFLYLRGRKSELVKTSTGRKVSLSRIERNYAESPYLNQVCVVGEGRPFLVALCTLDTATVQHWLSEHAYSPIREGDELNRRSEIQQLVEREFDRLSIALSVHERCARFAILSRDFSLADGELTPTLKLRRSAIYKSHTKIIDDLYRGEPCSADTTDRKQKVELVTS